MGSTVKYIAGIIGVSMLMVIIFVRAGEKGGAPGGVQAGRIIQAGAQGTAEIIRAATGV